MKRLLWLSPLLVAATCGTAPAETFETGPIKQPYDKVFATLQEMLERSRERYKLARVDKGAGVIYTEWKVTMSPHWREGERYKVEAVFERYGDATNVRIKAPAQFNDNGANPISEKDAYWMDGGGKNDVAEGLRMGLKLRLEGHSKD